MLKDLIHSGKKFSLGLVLSGGGARGFAHLGVLKALEEQGIKPDIISGVSAGAIVGAFYADGFSPEEIFDLFKKKGILRYSEFQIPRRGLLSLNGLKKTLEDNLSTKNLEELEVPFVVGVANFNLGKMEYMDKGSIAQVVLASSSIPVLFTPVQIGDYHYVDGGLYDNLPVEPIRGKCKKVIGVNANPIEEEYDFKNLIQVSIRTFHLVVDGTVQESREMVDHLIEPKKLAKYEILDSSKAEEMFEIGYEEGKKSLKEIADS